MIFRTLALLFVTSSSSFAGAAFADAGRTIFRYDTFGDEAFWGDALKLHQAIAGAEAGGVGPGLSPKAALGVGLKVDAAALSPAQIAALRNGTLDLDSPRTTLALLKGDAVIGIKGRFDRKGAFTSVGITCALCHSTVDDSLAAGIGNRQDGWANRDLDVGAIVALAPNLTPLTDALGVDLATVRQVLAGWGPGRYDAELLLDGKGFRPDGRTAATLLPPAFGLAGVNLHTYTGFGSVPYWNSYVAVTQMHGKGTFKDARLTDAEKFPVAARLGLGEVRSDPDLVTPKLAALHVYELSLAPPSAPTGSFDKGQARAGKRLFAGKAKCASCHVPPLFTDPGENLHSAAEIGIDEFQASRSPTGAYRTTPLRGLWSHQKGGFYHDGRFATLGDVINHYDVHLALNLDETEKAQLQQYLLSL